MDLWQSNRPIDAVILREELDKRQLLEEIGGTAGIGRMEGGEFVALDENGGWGDFSTATLPETGVYHIRVGSWGDVGSYSLSLEEREVVPLVTVPLTRGTDAAGYIVGWRCYIVTTNAAAGDRFLGTANTAAAVCALLAYAAWKLVVADSGMKYLSTDLWSDGVP